MKKHTDKNGKTSDEPQATSMDAKPPYQAPVVMLLGELSKGYGQNCSPGGSATGGGNCQPGGNAVGGSCQSGTTAVGGNCQNGGSVTGGNCQSGGGGTP